MRWFAWFLMATSAFLFGCNKPMETIPAITPIPSSGTTDSSGTTGSGTTMGGDHDHDGHDHDGHDHGDHEGHDHADHEGHEHAEGEEHEHAEGEEHEHAEGEHAEGEHAEEAASEEPKSDDTAATSSGTIRFVADKQLKVANMMCPFSCYPKVKETLAAMPGVEAVQLVEQKEEGVIDNPVVELKLSGDFDVEAAIAALSKVSFNAEVVN